MASTEELIKRQEKFIQSALKVYTEGTDLALKRVIDRQISRQAQFMVDQQAKIAKALEPSQKIIDQALQTAADIGRVADTISNGVYAKQVFETLPKLPDIQALYSETFDRIAKFVKVLEDEGLKSDEKLDEIGFGFSIEILMRVFSYHVFDDMDLAHRMPEEKVVATFTEIVNSGDFKPKLLEPYKSVAELKKRVTLIEIAYDLHKDGNYVASIPLLLIQIEFLVRTLLFLRDQIEVKGSKVYLLEDGIQKIDEDGNPVEIKGLGQLISNSDLDQDEVLNRLANLLSNKLVSARNDILHGTSYRYGKEKSSAQCLLVVFSLAHVMYGLDELDFDV